jgi:hypothetical protein
MYSRFFRRGGQLDTADFGTAKKADGKVAAVCL